MALLPSAGQTQPNDNNGSTTEGTTKRGALDSVLDVLDPAGLRKKISGLFDGGMTSDFAKSFKPKVNVVNSAGVVSDPKTALNTDWRVRVSLPEKSNLFYNSPDNKLLSILTRTRGVVFPYTPSISVTHNARYQEQALTHSNYKNYFYEGSDVSAIQVQGEFTVQNHDDAIYLLAVIYFFRSCTKMFFGNDTLAGNPPPIVYLDGYGDFYFPHVSCVVTSFQHTMPADCDYLEIKYASGGNNKTGVLSNSTMQVARLPTTSQITVTLQPVYSRKNIANNMTLGQFSQGNLLKGKGFL